MFVELVDGSKFELVDEFCYLGDSLCAGGGAEEASRRTVPARMPDILCVFGVTDVQRI